MARIKTKAGFKPRWTHSVFTVRGCPSQHPYLMSFIASIVP